MPEHENPFVPEPEPEKPKPDFTVFPYYDVCKVRNMYFAVDIPVFTALESQAEKVRDGYYRFGTYYCCN